MRREGWSPQMLRALLKELGGVKAGTLPGKGRVLEAWYR
jgi:hypothetical protein